MQFLATTVGGGLCILLRLTDRPTKTPVTSIVVSLVVARLFSFQLFPSLTLTNTFWVVLGSENRKKWVAGNDVVSGPSTARLYARLQFLRGMSGPLRWDARRVRKVVTGSVKPPLAFRRRGTITPPLVVAVLESLVCF